MVLIIYAPGLKLNSSKLMTNWFIFYRRFLGFSTEKFYISKSSSFFSKLEWLPPLRFQTSPKFLVPSLYAYRVSRKGVLLGGNLKPARPTDPHVFWMGGRGSEGEGLSQISGGLAPRWSCLPGWQKGSWYWKGGPIPVEGLGPKVCEFTRWTRGP